MYASCDGAPQLNMMKWQRQERKGEGYCYTVSVSFEKRRGDVSFMRSFQPRRTARVGAAEAARGREARGRDGAHTKRTGKKRCGHAPLETAELDAQLLGFIALLGCHDVSI